MKCQFYFVSYGVIMPAMRTVITISNYIFKLSWFCLKSLKLQVHVRYVPWLTSYEYIIFQVNCACCEYFDAFVLLITSTVLDYSMIKSLEISMVWTYHEEARMSRDETSVRYEYGSIPGQKKDGWVKWTTADWGEWKNICCADPLSMG